MCVLCGSQENLTNGHVLTRAAYSTRWDLINCHAQCIGCNMRHEYQPDVYHLWFINKFGLKEFEDLSKRHHTIRRWKDWELELEIQKYIL